MIPAKTKNHPVFGSIDSYTQKEMTLVRLFTSNEWAEYFRGLAKTLNFELSVYDEAGVELFATKETPFCKYIKEAQLDELNCADFCKKLIIDSLEADEPVTFKCRASLINFVLPVEHFGKRALIVGRGGFAEYDDLIEFLEIVKDNKLPGIPVTIPLDFPGEDYVKAVSRNVYLSVISRLNSFEDENRIEEKLLRMTSLFDSMTFRTLSEKPDLMYRYILDAVEFIFGRSSGAMLVKDDESSSYRTVYSTGRYKDITMGFHFEAQHPVILEMLSTGASVFTENPEKVAGNSPLSEINASYFFPIFDRGGIKIVIWIFDRIFSRKDMKIMSVFRDYVQLNLENHDLRALADKNRKAARILASLADFQGTIISVMDRDGLLKTLLEKSIGLLDAEQGSLMLFDDETSELVVEAKKSFDDTVKEKMRLKKEESIAGFVLDSGGSLLVEDIEKDPRFGRRNYARYKTKSFVSVPLSIQGKVKGVINLSDKTEGGIFNEDDLNLIQSFINNAVIAIDRSLLFRQTEEFKKLSITDPLTGIYNRRYLNSRLSEEITRYNRYKHPFSFLMFDLDGFKEYNDTYGHISGDSLLKTLVSVIEESLRTIDIAARFGGDEFVTIFPQTPKINAIQITNRLKEKIDRALGRYSIEIPLTVSMGLATYPDDASSIMELIEKTDQALYLAKKGGGNRIVYL